MLVRLLFMSFLALAVLGQPASAACYADYKAKQDSGALQLHYGVVKLSNAACGNEKRAEQEVAQKIARGGWQLLNVVSIFEDNELDAKKSRAGDYFLRF